MLKVCLIIGGSMLLVGFVSNIFAVVLEKKYKSKMEEISEDK